MKFRAWIAVPAMMLLMSGLGAGLAAQEPGAEGAQAVPTAEEEQDQAKERLPFGLWVMVAGGAVDADRIDPSIRSSSVSATKSELLLEGMVHSMAGIGWKLPRDKGDFRLIFNGLKEDGYAFESVGTVNNVPAYVTSAIDGHLSTTRLAEMDVGERTITDDLQNRLQTIDFVYGRTFGKRHYTARWWGGVRHWKYDGNIPAAAWLSPDVGFGFTDGFLLRYINLSQEASGSGPTGALEADFNFFNDQLTFFVGGSFAFTLSDVSTDSGDFLIIVNDSDLGGQLKVTFPSHVSASRNKSTWQDRAELGARIRLKSGVEFELAYSISGYLDAVLTPTEFILPQDELAAQRQGASAIYNTQDIVVDGARFGVSLQF